MNAPPREFGGKSPVVAYLRHSMTVVLPTPLAPQIKVKGVLKTRVWASWLSKARMPLMLSSLSVDIVNELAQCTWWFTRALLYFNMCLCMGVVL